MEIGSRLATIILKNLVGFIQAGTYNQKTEIIFCSIGGRKIVVHSSHVVASNGGKHDTRQGKRSLSLVLVLIFISILVRVRVVGAVELQVFPSRMQTARQLRNWGIHSLETRRV